MIIHVLIILAIVTALFAPFTAAAALLLLPIALLHIRRSPPVNELLTWVMYGWLIWLPLSLVFSISPGLALPQIAVLICLPLAWLTGSWLRDQRQLDFWLDLGIPVLLLTLIIWGLLQGPNTFTIKPQGPFNDPNTYAATLNLLALPMLARYLTSNLVDMSRWERTGLLALLSGFLFMQFLIASRGATLALLIVALVLLWYGRRQTTFLRKLGTITVVGLIAYVAAMHTNDGLSVGTRLLNTVQEGDRSRLLLWQSAWAMIQDHPWLGTGLGSFRLLYPHYRSSEELTSAGGWVHNDFLQLWLEAGLPMLALLLGLLYWVLITTLRIARSTGKQPTRDLGYMAGICAVLIHSFVNFILFYTLICIILGLYLARLSTSATEQRSVSGNALRLTVSGYSLIICWLLIGQIVVEVALGQAKPIQKALVKLHVTYPRYDIAYWTSVIAPFHPSPQQIMGLELASAAAFTSSREMLNEAINRMDIALKQAPCYLPFGNDALSIINIAVQDNNLRKQGLAIATRNLSCDPGHGLSLYYAGLFADSQEEALRLWRLGLRNTQHLADKLLIITAILARTTPGREETLTTLAEEMALEIKRMENNPVIHANQAYWAEAQYKLLMIAGVQFQELMVDS